MTCIDSQIRCVLFIILAITVFASVSDINNVHVTVNGTLVGVDDWLKTNRLSLNVSKTSYMIISNHKYALNFEIQSLLKFEK